MLVVLEPLSDSLRRELAAWLETHLPVWAGFKLAEFGKYLGFYLGPGASEQNWSTVAEKATYRAFEIHSTTMPAQFALRAFNRTVATLAIYISQFLAPPKWLAKFELRLIHKALKLPSNTFSRKAILSLDQVGLINALSLELSAYAAAGRAALKTLLLT